MKKPDVCLEEKTKKRIAKNTEICDNRNRKEYRLSGTQCIAINIESPPN
jgi:hypothetical protein